MKNLEEYNSAHQNQPIIIIGAGVSVHYNDLTLLDGITTISVNSGCLATPANYFISDDWCVSSWNFFYEDLVNSDTIPLLYEAKLGKWLHLFGDRGVLFRHRKGIKISDRYDHIDAHFHIGETRTSLGSGIQVAKIMGASRIGILGLDGCRHDGLRYFWQLPEYKKPRRNDGVPIDRYQRCKIGGISTDRDLVEIGRTWNTFGKAVNKKCTVYNLSEKSIIDVFPKMTLKEFVDA